MVISSSLDDDDGVLDVVLFLGLANQLDGQFEAGRLVLQCSRLDEQVAKIVGHHPLRAMLGRIHTDDGEPFTAHLLDARSDDAIRVLQRRVRAGFGSLVTATSSWMVRHLDAP